MAPCQENARHWPRPDAGQIHPDVERRLAWHTPRIEQTFDILHPRKAAPFDAGGGVTDVFGGDAVGILILGTAVLLEKDLRTGCPVA